MNFSEIDSGLNIISRIWGFIKKGKPTSKKLEKKNMQTENSYYFENYTKHVTIYKNGNGIIINSADLIVTDVENFTKIYRRLNIEDSKIDSNFPLLEEMMKLDKSERFDKFGFWYYSEEDIIRSANEFYWSDTDKSKQDKKLKKNSKEIRWVFEFNKSKIKENKKYKIIYIFSIEGMYPIDNGKFLESVVNDPNSITESESSIEIIQDIKNFTYIVSFEDGIVLDISPVCEISKYLKEKNVPVPEKHEYNILFNKYIFKVEKPVLGSKIKVYWKFN